jgi:1,4-alpha-glucan branching enzyme
MDLETPNLGLHCRDGLRRHKDGYTGRCFPHALPTPMPIPRLLPPDRLRAAAFVAAGLLALAGASRSAAGAERDNNIEWYGLASDPHRRQPLYPKRGEAFSVELRAFRGDLSSARVRVWDGAERLHPMAWARNEGGHEVWRATVTGSQSDYLYYYFELSDGSDRDYLNALGVWDDAPPRGDFFLSLTPWGGYALGATALESGAVFRVWAPGASAAAVAGDFNGWSLSAHALARNRGYWEGFVPGARAGQEYKFAFDGGALWRTDPRSRAVTSSVGNSKIVQPRGFAWGDAGWETPYFEEMVVYELHVGSFSGEGDGGTNYPGRFRDLAGAHLDHLAELGVNVIELMPLGEFAGDISWGYNPAFLFAPESAYGSPDDLRALVDRCHRRGLAVILDVVFNHMGPSDLAGNLLEYDGDEIYFYPSGSPWRESPWGPRLDYGRLEVRELVRDCIRHWLTEYHLDGLRLDGTDFVKVNGDGWELLKDIALAVDSVSPKAIVIAEQLPNDPAVSRPIEEGGAGADSQWNDLFHDSLREAVRAAAFGDPNLGAVAAGINHFALGAGYRALNYIESHDEAAVHGRIPVEADRSDPDGPWAQGRARVAAALVLFSAGIPMLLQGQELLESRPFGDQREHRVDWRKKAQNAGFFRFMKDAVRLRRTQPALRADGAQNLYHVNDADNVLALQRWTAAGNDLVVVVSLANREFGGYRLGFPLAGTWHEILNGDAAIYGGENRGNGGRIEASGGALHGLPASASITLPRMAVLVFAREPLPAQGFLRGDCQGDGEASTADATAMLRWLFLREGALDCLAACDANGDAALDIADPLRLLFHVFLGGPAPPAPWPQCGEATAGVLGCAPRSCR